jgi:hypothetical protein
VLAATKKVSALNPSAAGAPAHAISAPPSSGPASRLSCSATPNSAFALGRSALSTRLGMMVPLAGQKKASAMPTTTPTANRCQMCSAWAADNAASAPIATPRARCAASMSRRGESRSVIAPPTSSSSPLGTVAASITAPSAAGDRVTDSTSQTKATS